MIKFIKEIFSSENFKKAMVYASLANPNMSLCEYVRLSNIIKDMDKDNL